MASPRILAGASPWLEWILLTTWSLFPIGKICHYYVAVSFWSYVFAFWSGGHWKLYYCADRHVQSQFIKLRITATPAIRMLLKVQPRCASPSVNPCKERGVGSTVLLFTLVTKKKRPFNQSLLRVVWGIIFKRSIFYFILCF